MRISRNWTRLEVLPARHHSRIGHKITSKNPHFSSSLSPKSPFRVAHSDIGLRTVLSASPSGQALVAHESEVRTLVPHAPHVSQSCYLRPMSYLLTFFVTKKGASSNRIQYIRGYGSLRTTGTAIRAEPGGLVLATGSSLSMIRVKLRLASLICFRCPSFDDHI